MLQEVHLDKKRVNFSGVSFGKIFNSGLIPLFEWAKWNCRICGCNWL